jgi:hypothetical protein
LNIKRKIPRQTNDNIDKVTRMFFKIVQCRQSEISPPRFVDYWVIVISFGIFHLIGSTAWILNPPNNRIVLIPERNQFIHDDTTTTNVENHRSLLCNTRIIQPPYKLYECIINRNTRLYGMKWWNDLFLSQRQGDFVKLQDTTERYGPGPVLLLYNIPNEIENDEIIDMIQDTCTQRTSDTCQLYRLVDDHSVNPYPELDLTVFELMTEISNGKVVSTSSLLKRNEIVAAVSSSTYDENENIPTSVLFFSGFTNTEMMDLYNVLSNEIYQEIMSSSTGSTSSRRPPACAKAVPNCMNKSMRQVITEICGDHLNAIQVVSTESSDDDDDNTNDQ